MMFARQRTLPFASRSPKPALQLARAVGVQSLRNPGAGGRSSSRAIPVGQRATQVGQVGAKSFAEKRLHHAVELAGACIMMAAFLVVALFS